MGFVKVPDHRPPLLGSKPDSTGSVASLSLPRTTLLYKILLCLALLLLPLLATAERSPHNSDVLDGPLTFDVPSINTTWEVGGHAEITVCVRHGSDAPALQRDAAKHISPDGINMLLVPYRARSNIVLSTESDLALITQERRGEDVILRYRWPVPLCLPSGKHTLSVWSPAMGLRWPSPLTIPILVVVPDYRARVTCSSGLQFHLRTPGRSHQHQVQPKANRSPLSARDANAPDGEPDATTVTDGETPITMSPSSLPATVVVEPRDLYDSDDYTSGGYSDSYTSGGGYSATYTSSGYYTTPTATSYSASGTYTPSGNGMSSVSGNSSSVSVVTTTATRTSVRTVTSVSTDIETMLTTVTGPDSTGVFTTTQTLLSTIVVATASTGDFLPVNGASRPAMLPLTGLVAVCASTVLWLLCSADCCVV